MSRGVLAMSVGIIVVIMGSRLLGRSAWRRIEMIMGRNMSWRLCNDYVRGLSRRWPICTGIRSYKW